MAIISAYYTTQCGIDQEGATIQLRDDIERYLRVHPYETPAVVALRTEPQDAGDGSDEDSSQWVCAIEVHGPVDLDLLQELTGLDFEAGMED